MDNESLASHSILLWYETAGLPVLIRFDVIPQSMLSKCRDQKGKTAAGKTGFYGLHNRYLLTETK